MKPRTVQLLLLALIPLAFLAGYLLKGGSTESVPAGPGGRKVLYYTDPMNPGFRSSEPGIAPCGMPLEPVYEESAGAGGSAETRLASMPPGTVSVRPDRQQLAGMRSVPVERQSTNRTLRLLGRVAPDERRLYRLYSVTDGWIKEVSGVTTGSLVRKDDLLARYYSQEVLGPQQAYIYALEALDRFVESGTASPDQIELNRKNVRTTKQVLENLGMPETQIEEITLTRQAGQTVELRAPASGFVLARNVSLGQRFDRTTELYIIADLGRVWILADVFESEGTHLRPGLKTTARLPGRSDVLDAVVSSVPPQFDASTRTLKIRLEVENPGYVLRPDMFVDIEAPVTLPPTLAIPSSALLDSGLQKTVFVDRGEGFFEPRRVETGWRQGDVVEITRGLMDGEKVVVSGNFFLDSESRMRLAGAASAPPTSRDPVCGMDVDEGTARSEGRTSEHKGRTYFFCAPGCKESFDRDPAPYIARGAAQPGAGAAHGDAHD